MAGAAPPAASAPAEQTDEEEDFEPDPALREDVSVTTKITQSAQKTPASVSVITADQISRAGYRSVGEALAAVPGLFVSYDLEAYHVAVRGLFGGARAGARFVKVMIDSRPAGFLQMGTSFLGPEFVPITAVERIEVMRGPASSLYGAGALVGAINIVTIRPAYEGETAYRQTGNIDLATGGRRIAGFDVTHTTVGKDFFLLLALNGAYEDRSGMSVPSDSPFAKNFADAAGRPRLSARDYARPLSALLRAEYLVGGGRVGAMASLQLHDASAEFHDLTVLSHNTRVGLVNWLANLSYEKPFANGLAVSARVGFTRGGTTPADRFDFGSRDVFYLERRLGYDELSAMSEVRYDVGRGGWLLMGIDGTYDWERFQQYVEVNRTTGAVRERPAPSRRVLANLAAYGQILYPLAKWISVSAGARYDQHNVYGGAVSGRLGLVVQLRRNLTLKLLSGRSYKPPSPEQLYGVAMAPLDVEGRPDIRQQFVLGGEAILDWFPTRSVNLNIGGFVNRYSNALAYVSRGGQLRPTSFDADSFGGEAQIRAVTTVSGLNIEWSSALSAVRLITSETRVGGLVVKDVPDDESVPKISTTSRLHLRFESIGLGPFVAHRYIGSRVPSQSNLSANGTTSMREPTYMLQPFHIVDVGVATKNYAIGPMQIGGVLRVTNVLDARYSEIGFNGVDVPGLGRTFWIQMRVSG